jgi:hypothetical protein
MAVQCRSEPRRRAQGRRGPLGCEDGIVWGPVRKARLYRNSVQVRGGFSLGPLLGHLCHARPRLHRPWGGGLLAQFGGHKLFPFSK